MDNVILYNNSSTQEKNLRWSLSDVLYENYFDFLQNITDDAIRDNALVFYISRKAYALWHSFANVINNSDTLMENAQVANSNMLLLALANYKKCNEKWPSRIIVVDDVMLYGKAINRMVKRIKKVKKELCFNNCKIEVRVFAVNETCEHKFIKPGWKAHNNVFYHESLLRGYAPRFLSAIHTCGIPYTSHMAAFECEYTSAIFNKLIDFVKGKFDTVYDFGQQYTNRPDRTYAYGIDVLPLHYSLCVTNVFEKYAGTSSQVSFSSLRIYVNPHTGKILFVPHLSLRPFFANKKYQINLWNAIPSDWKKQLKGFCKKGIKDDYVTQATYLLMYMYSYQIGYMFLADCFGKESADSMTTVNTHLLGASFASELNKANDSIFTFKEKKAPLDYDSRGQAKWFYKNTEVLIGRRDSLVDDKKEDMLEKLTDSLHDHLLQTIRFEEKKGRAFGSIIPVDELVDKISRYVGDNDESYRQQLYAYLISASDTGSCGFRTMISSKHRINKNSRNIPVMNSYIHCGELSLYSWLLLSYQTFLSNIQQFSQNQKHISKEHVDSWVAIIKEHIYAKTKIFKTRTDNTNKRAIDRLNARLDSTLPLAFNYWGNKKIKFFYSWYPQNDIEDENLSSFFSELTEDVLSFLYSLDVSQTIDVDTSSRSLKKCLRADL